MTVLWVGDEAAIAAWVAARFPHIGAFPASARAVSWVRVFDDGSGEIIGGVVACPRGGGFDAELSIALEGVYITRAQLRTLLGLCFEKWGWKRLTCHIARGNKRARDFVERVGFRREGALKHGFDGRQTAVVYGMTRDECRWL